MTQHGYAGTGTTLTVEAGAGTTSSGEHKLVFTRPWEDKIASMSVGETLTSTFTQTGTTTTTTNGVTIGPTTHTQGITWNGRSSASSG